MTCGDLCQSKHYSFLSSLLVSNKTLKEFDCKFSFSADKVLFDVFSLPGFFDPIVSWFSSYFSDSFTTFSFSPSPKISFPLKYLLRLFTLLYSFYSDFEDTSVKMTPQSMQQSKTIFLFFINLFYLCLIFPQNTKCQQPQNFSHL